MTMAKLLKYARAFFGALKMTLRGQTPPTPAAKHPEMDTWIRDGLKVIADTLRVANQMGLDQTARSAIRLQIEGRETTMEAILGGVYFHLVQEYHYLLQNETNHNLTAIHASNLNDQFRVFRLREALSVMNQPKYTEIINELVLLQKHLESIPARNNSGN